MVRALRSSLAFSMRHFRYGLVFLLFCISHVQCGVAADPAVAQKVPGKQLPIPGELFQVEGRSAFLIGAPAPSKSKTGGMPWVWYAPTLPPYPGTEERWMFQQFTNAGISIAGIDVGESYGSPAGRKLYTTFYREMTRRRFSPLPMLLGRSRGGLMTLAWAEKNPDKVSGFAGIYPVCNLESYPGIDKAAAAYEISATELKAKLAEYNPIDRLKPLAKAGVPLFAIHGDEDKVVPLEANSALMRDRYSALGGHMQLIVAAGQGHNMWSGFFECWELVDFVKRNAR